MYACTNRYMRVHTHSLKYKSINDRNAFFQTIQTHARDAGDGSSDPIKIKIKTTFKKDKIKKSHCC